ARPQLRQAAREHNALASACARPVQIWASGRRSIDTITGNPRVVRTRNSHADERLGAPILRSGSAGRCYFEISRSKPPECDHQPKQLHAKRAGEKIASVRSQGEKLRPPQYAAIRPFGG